MSLVGPHKVYIRDWQTPIFNSKATQSVVTPCTKGFGGYFSCRDYDKKTEKTVWGTLTDGMGGQLLGATRIQAFFGEGYSWDGDCEYMHPCLAFFGGRVWPGWTMGKGCVADFDGTSYSIRGLDKDEMESELRDAKRDALQQAERAAEREAAYQESERIEQEAEERRERVEGPFVFSEFADDDFLNRVKEIIHDATPKELQDNHVLSELVVTYAQTLGDIEEANKFLARLGFGKFEDALE